MRRKLVCAAEEFACGEITPVEFCKMYPKYCPGRDASKAYPAAPYMNAISTTTYNWEETKTLSHNTTMFAQCSKSVGKDFQFCKLPYKAVPSVTLEGYQNYCFTVESQWGNPDAEPQKYTNYFSIIMHLDTQLDDYIMYTNPVRMHVVLHDRKERVNTYVNGFTLEGGVRYIAHVSMVSTQRLPYPYDTNCTDYIALWRKNNGTGPLSKSMCVEQCKLNKLLRMNRCVDKTVTYPHEEQLCNETKITEEILESCYEECGSACNEHTYEVRLEDIGNLAHRCQDTDEYCKERFVYLDFSFLRFRHTEYIYQPKFANIELYSYAGGYMGMWLGLSLISLFDLFETLCYLLLYPIGRMSGRKKNKVKIMFYPGRKLDKKSREFVY